MSGWDAWTDGLLEKGAYYCGIHGRDGNPWSSRNMSIPPADAKLLEEYIRKNDQEIFSKGVLINKEKWVPVRMEDGVLVMKGHGDNKDKLMTVCLTKQALVFGCNKDSSTQGGQVRNAVEEVKANLENSGY